ncbi:MAG: dockerin type I repeat-containing protein, partial [Candidatus Pacebacteria bacterium]|nr:dockerin type I repeat-containing protein [Candidatus Paceibacterota bacterium]
DAQVIASSIAGADANFKMSASNLSAGNYIFSIFSEDKGGRRSSLQTFPVSVTAGAATEVSGIFIAPSIDVGKKEVKRGDNIAIFGQTVPLGNIVIFVHSAEEFFAKTISDKEGVYLYNFDTSALEYGSHIAKSKASTGNQLVSRFSSIVNFKVGTQNIIKEKEKNIILKGEVNNDGKVNLVDFSIAAYWYKRPSPPANIDLNNDGKISLVDFSIMAYYWTG